MSQFSHEIEMVQGDTGPALSVTIKDENGEGAIPGKPDTWPAVDLTGVSNTDIVVKASKAGVANALTLTSIITTPAEGKITITPEGSGMLDSPGLYKIEISITKQSVKVTISNWIRCTVRPRVA